MLGTTHTTLQTCLNQLLGMRVLCGHFFLIAHLHILVCGLSEDPKPKTTKIHVSRDWTTTSNSMNNSTLNNECDWEDLCVRLRNQQTCASNNHDYIKSSQYFEHGFRRCFIIDLQSQHKIADVM